MTHVYNAEFNEITKCNSASLDLKYAALHNDIRKARVAINKKVNSHYCRVSHCDEAAIEFAKHGNLEAVKLLIANCTSTNNETVRKLLNLQD